MRPTEVAISLKLLLQARFAAEGTALCAMLDDALAREAERTDEATNNNVIERLRHIAVDGSVGKVIPFRLGPLDVNIASVLLRKMSTKDQEGIIFGVNSLVNAGFIVVCNNDIQYVDSWVEGARTDPRTVPSSIAARLIPSNLQRFRTEVEELVEVRPTAMTAHGEEPAIIIQGAKLGNAAKAIQPSSFSCHMLDPYEESSKRSALSGVRVAVAGDQNALRLTPTRPETLIQLSAAHQQRRWMEVAGGDIRALFAVPDISEEGHSCPAWVLGLVDDESYVFSRYSTDIRVATDVALECCDAFRWFVIPDSVEMAKRLSTAALEIRGLPS